jgi:hypothetical protein
MKCWRFHKETFVAKNNGVLFKLASENKSNVGILATEFILVVSGITGTAYQCKVIIRKCLFTTYHMTKFFGVFCENAVEIETRIVTGRVLDDNESDSRLSIFEVVISNYLKMLYSKRKEQLS